MIFFGRIPQFLNNMKNISYCCIALSRLMMPVTLGDFYELALFNDRNYQ